MDCLCYTPVGATTKIPDDFDTALIMSENESSEPHGLECDYDTNPTYIYQAIEARQWEHAIAVFRTEVEFDPYGRQQAATWVSRKEADTQAGGAIRWRQLPIHAALVFKSPTELISALVNAYPEGVRCENDQGMLPLHLAFRHGAPASILAILLREYPESIRIKDKRDRVPLDCAMGGQKTDMSEVICAFVADAVDSEKSDSEKKIYRIHAEHITTMKKLRDAHTEEVESAEKAFKKVLKDLKESKKSNKDLLKKIIEIHKVQANTTAKLQETTKELEKTTMALQAAEDVIAHLKSAKTPVEAPVVDKGVIGLSCWAKREEQDHTAGEK